MHRYNSIPGCAQIPFGIWLRRVPCGTRLRFHSHLCKARYRMVPCCGAWTRTKITSSRGMRTTIIRLRIAFKYLFSRGSPLAGRLRNTVKLYQTKLNIVCYNNGMSEIKKTALVNAIATALYIIAVGSFMYYGSVIKLGRANIILVPITLLLLFVFSAALTGFLIFGKPAQMYVDGKKKEALSLLTYTLSFFSIITLVALGLLIVFTR